MPITYNGIGTHYYGHRNSERRTAACHSCGRTVQLESYDTRLWFVIVFIPVIPLGRKRIIDQCPVCKRHFVADADTWETQKQLNVSGTMEEYLADPTPEKAMAAHQMLLNFHQAAAAAEFRKEIGEKFRQNAKLQAYLGQALLAKGQGADGAMYFQRALLLRPDLPEARVGVARSHIAAGKLDEARALLDFLEKPGAAQLYSLEPLETLAGAYERVGKREPALQLYGCLLAGLPAIGEIPAFRKKVKACEKALGRKETILPKWKFSWKRLFGGGPKRQRQRSGLGVTWRSLGIVVAVVAIFVGLIFFHGLYQSHHRPLYILNAFRDTATVTVSDEKTVQVAGGGQHWQQLEVAEGHHHVTINGPLHEELDIDVTPNGAGHDPIWLVNPGGRSLLLEQHVTYKAGSPPPPKVDLHFGRNFERLDNVSHPFKALPPSITMNSNESERVLTGLNFSQTPVDELLTWLQLRERNGDMARLAEWQLKYHPEDTMALEAFVQQGAPKHVEEVLQAGLRRRPVDMQWHRNYQNLHTGVEWDHWMAVAYDGMLKEEPRNSALLYLRGRIATEPGESASWFVRALEADPSNPFPYFAQGYDHVSNGDWAGARPLFARAVELLPTGPGFADALFNTRLALEEYAPLEAELRARIAREKLDFNSKLQLVQLLVVENQPKKAEQVVVSVEEQARQTGDTGLQKLAEYIRTLYLYAIGDFAHLVQNAQKDRTPAGRLALFMALLEQGKVAEALRAYSLEKAGQKEELVVLTVSLAWSVAHDEAQADVWRQRAVKLLRAGGPDEIRTAALLELDKNATITPEALAAVVLDARSKALLLAVLGTIHTSQREELFAAARKLNVERQSPYQLVQRTVGGAP